jgi:hypothetical protein
LFTHRQHADQTHKKQCQPLSGMRSVHQKLLRADAQSQRLLRGACGHLEVILAKLYWWQERPPRLAMREFAQAALARPASVAWLVAGRIVRISLPCKGLVTARSSAAPAMELSVSA